MVRKELFAYVAEHHQVNPEYLWKKNPNYAVLRHHYNRKWYAIIMDVEAEKLGLKGTLRRNYRFKIRTRIN